MDMYDLLGIKSPQTQAIELAKRFKMCRKQFKITQKDLASKSGIKYGTIRHFEQTGQISLTALLVLADTLNMLKDFELLFNPEKYIDIRKLANEDN